VNTPAPHPPAGFFAPTRWTVIQRARGDSAEARQALGELCEAYWTPVFRFLRGQGRDEDTARELTQEFFARVLARGSLQGAEPGRGRFRSYLLGAVKHFLADCRDHEQRLKRGGGAQIAPLDASGPTGTAPALQVPDPAATPDDRLFDHAWALAVMERALISLGSEYARQDRAAHFEALKPWLQGEAPGLSQAEAAARLGMNESALKVAIHRLRKRFREAVRAELAQTVAAETEVDEELGYLVEVLAQGSL
jgi:RNA polymerase sigma-70 factor (ECF subfamily)